MKQRKRWWQYLAKSKTSTKSSWCGPRANYYCWHGYQSVSHNQQANAAVAVAAGELRRQMPVSGMADARDGDGSGALTTGGWQRRHTSSPLEA